MEAWMIVNALQLVYLVDFNQYVIDVRRIKRCESLL